MKRLFSVVSVAILCVVLFSGLAQAESATPQEVIAKTQEAAAFLASKGEVGLADFNGKNSSWAWKDTYVFVFDCAQDKVTAHIASKLVGSAVSSIVDKKGNYLGMELCIASESPNGGWIEYWWPKHGSDTPVRKVSYMLKVPGTNWEVGAGIYDENKSLDELNAMIK